MKRKKHVISCFYTYYMSISGFCKKYCNINLFEIQRDNSNNNITREIHINVENPEQSATFLCDCGLTIDIFLFNDLIPDCGFVADDEPILLSLLTKNKTFPCNLPFELPCKQGHLRCYKLTHVSRYALEFPVPLADLIALSPGYRVPPDLATVPYASWYTRFALPEAATLDRMFEMTLLAP